MPELLPLACKGHLCYIRSEKLCADTVSVHRALMQPIIDFFHAIYKRAEKELRMLRDMIYLRYTAQDRLNDRCLKRIRRGAGPFACRESLRAVRLFIFRFSWNLPARYCIIIGKGPFAAHTPRMRRMPAADEDPRDRLAGKDCE